MPMPEDKKKEEIEKPLPVKVAKGKTSFVCAGISLFILMYAFRNNICC
jgi:hypothetical protein